MEVACREPVMGGFCNGVVSGAASWTCRLFAGYGCYIRMEGGVAVVRASLLWLGHRCCYVGMYGWSASWGMVHLHVFTYDFTVYISMFCCAATTILVYYRQCTGSMRVRVRIQRMKAMYYLHTQPHAMQDAAHPSIHPQPRL